MKPTGHLLIVEGSVPMAESLQGPLLARGYAVLTAAGGEQALELLERETVDVVLLAEPSAEGDGLELLSRIHEEYPAAMVIVLNADAQVRKVVDAMRRGAFDVVVQPFEMEQLEVVLSRAVDVLGMRRQIGALSRHERHRYLELIGDCALMRGVFSMIEKIAPTDSTALVTGQSGTGKELVARAIHQRSPRAGRPFVAISCTALQETLLESELFGHEKGAFTDAAERKEGLFELASRGTLFLDEVGDMDLKIQGKLLRALEDRSIRRVGGTRNLKVDVRVIAATHRDLSSMVQAGEFREDLYYRLRVVPIHLPPLNQRDQDVVLLAEAFVADFNSRFGKNVRGLTAAAEQALQRYHWPGNIRELRNVLERVILLEDCELIDLENLPAEVGGPSKAAPLRGRRRFQAAKTELVCQFEQRYLHEILTRCRGNVSAAAQQAGMERGSFQRLMRKHGFRSTTYRRPSSPSEP